MSNFFAKWFGLIDAIAETTGTDLYRKNAHTTWKSSPELWQWDSQFLKGSPANYLAKYLSKGARQFAKHGLFYPSRWWGVDRQSVAEANRLRTTWILNGHTAHHLSKVLDKIRRVALVTAKKTYAFANRLIPKMEGLVIFCDGESSKDLMLICSELMAANRCPALLK
jgi:hypothetical protein